MYQYSCINDDNRAILNRAGIRALTEDDFWFRASTRPRLQAFKICLENESQVGTLICRNLLVEQKPIFSHLSIFIT